MDEEEVIAWQDVLDEIAAGRTGNTRCPSCGTSPMRIESLDEARGEGEGGPMRIICSKCGKFIEGTFGGY